MTEIKKYVIRFGIVLLIALPIMAITQGVNALRIISYKVALVAVAIGLAELLWAVFFKTVFGKTEEMNPDDKKSILMFRGILYAAILLALSLGL